MCLDIEERHLLRLGHGEEELDTEKDFSRYGRVNFILALRMELLKEVERLQVSQILTACSSYHTFFSAFLLLQPERRLGTNHCAICFCSFFVRKASGLVEMCRTRVRQPATSSSTRSWQDGKTTLAKSRH